jgi:rubredoxin
VTDAEEQPQVITEEMQADPSTAFWKCTSCGFIYDPQLGDPDGGIDPGTPFEEVPDAWFCPVCGAMKRDFRKMDPGEELPEDAEFV